jgi:hypothetical protein
MPKIFDKNLVLSRAKEILKKTGIINTILNADSKKGLTIRCRYLKAVEVPPKVVYDSAVTVTDYRGIGKRGVSYNGKELAFSPEAVTAIKEEFEPLSLTYPQQV